MENPETAIAVNPTPPADAVETPVAAENQVHSEAPEQPEPQNGLTQKFTENEWKAVKEFRAELPAVFKEAERTDAVTMWGITLSPTGSPDAKTSVLLVKFLRARNLSIPEAKTMLVNTLRWRDEMKIDEIMKEEFPKDIFGNLGHVYGKDKGGRPVTYNLYGGNSDLQSVFGDTKRFIRWRIQLMEKGVQLLDFENIDQMVQVHDYEGVGMSSRTPESKAAAGEATNIFQSHYPELLYKKFFVNVPTFMSWIFWLFKPLLSAQTVAKMSVVGRGAATIGKELSVVIDPQELPKRYGGDAEGF